ncbi:hypothetical protein OGAPHI_005192 [Ogataea philodendri]|uniref:Uncharacterized protein n=1 Tax=Ogataea philodendri TaxID=1378263 RepID=A0A9P8P2B4_9ASCO|nr:uncharacterized protein OGAPHI_005192 [Ogataea philodendri]KAH3663789.1 hypothetical protein OGAPHI_005192 [Ogataea philodendri]
MGPELDRDDLIPVVALDSAVGDLKHKNVGGAKILELVHDLAHALALHHGGNSNPLAIVERRNGGCSSTRGELQQLGQHGSWGVVVAEHVLLGSKNTLEPRLDHLDEFRVRWVLRNNQMSGGVEDGVDGVQPGGLHGLSALDEIHNGISDAQSATGLDGTTHKLDLGLDRRAGFDTLELLEELGGESGERRNDGLSHELLWRLVAAVLWHLDLLLSFPEFHQQVAIAVHFLDLDHQLEVQQQQELQLQVVELLQRQPSDFSVSGVFIENVAEKLTGHGDSRDDESVDISLASTIFCSSADSISSRSLTWWLTMSRWSPGGPVCGSEANVTGSGCLDSDEEENCACGTAGWNWLCCGSTEPRGNEEDWMNDWDGADAEIKWGLWDSYVGVVKDCWASWYNVLEEELVENAMSLEMVVVAVAGAGCGGNPCCPKEPNCVAIGPE